MGTTTGSAARARIEAHREDPMPFEDRPLIRSESTKYDGSIHYEFDTRLIDNTDGCLRLWIPAGTPNRSYRGEGVFEADCVMLAFLDDHERGFNVVHYWAPIRGALAASDILTATHLDGSTLRWIDLDLDVEVFDDGRVELVDEDEFEEHQVRYAYPPAIIEGARKSAALSFQLATGETFPFDREQQFDEVWRRAAAAQ